MQYVALFKVSMVTAISIQSYNIHGDHDGLICTAFVHHSSHCRRCAPYISLKLMYLLSRGYVFAFVCLSVSSLTQKICERILMTNLGVDVMWVATNDRIFVVICPNHDADPGIFLKESFHCGIC